MFARRRIALSLAASCAALPLAACSITIGDDASGGRSSSGSASPGTGGRTAANGGTPSSGTGQGGPVQNLRVGAMTLRIPTSWRAVPGGAGGRWHITTGGSCAGTDYPRDDTCHGWWVFGAADIALGNEGNPYTPDRPFYPRTDSVPCPTDPSTFQTTPQAPQEQGFAPVGTHKGHYRAWAITCISPAGGAKKGGFTQREVYLPDSHILILDSWQTPGLSEILSAAVWN